ncbi:MAG: glycosyltransferase [Agathobacter sp.]|uniref:glycosyltransferase family protein n=1 Tax=Agathobacter sp. TaxID=2021311 RepID=UPI00258C343D|nr:glycosyltransferase [Agathobacter sp.]MCR5676932.1 glycosyltransferase [Agathobacter sp.]
MKFLIIYSKPICYNSLEFFTDTMAESLRNLGHTVDSLTSFDKPERFIPYFDKEYDRIIDFNSNLPLMKMDDGSPVLSHLKGRFYNYLLEHPLHHHKVLSVTNVEQNVICIDRKHVEYVRTYYPHIREAIFLPVGSMPGDPKKIKPIRGRNIAVFFPGTYTSTNWATAKMAVMPPELKQELIWLYEKMRDDYTLELPDALKQYAQEKMHLTIPDEEMAEYVHRHFLADTFICAYVRDRVIRALLEAHIPVTVCGGGWQEFDDPNNQYLIILPAKDYEAALEMTYDAKILLNVMPHFKDGMHDRVLTAMSHGAVCVTDATDYIRENFTDDRDLILYDLQHLSELPRVIAEYLEDENQLQKIAEAAGYAVSNNFTWEKLLSESELCRE